MKQTKLVIQLTVPLAKADAVTKRLNALAARGDKPVKVVAVINQIGRFQGLVKNVPVKHGPNYPEGNPRYTSVKLALFDKPAPAPKVKPAKPAPAEKVKATRKPKTVATPSATPAVATHKVTVAVPPPASPPAPVEQPAA